jgi:hypothetical protein
MYKCTSHPSRENSTKLNNVSELQEINNSVPTILKRTMTAESEVPSNERSSTKTAKASRSRRSSLFANARMSFIRFVSSSMSIVWFVLYLMSHSTRYSFPLIGRAATEVLQSKPYEEPLVPLSKERPPSSG